ncbi:hypothetical protein GO613_00450 [Azoarcus communis]|uniref:hypothetical protein n=1 Tax=Parazoarcus communis TaxID=41977 RepID=UPI001459AFD0|nr:hypothetical protein [Parazoarcus communis]NMG46579.1 hypothetical protein [Parazoarcus communis]
MNARGKKRGIAITGSWLPLPLEFLRSRACAELSPHGIKLLIDFMAMLGPNATRNGDVSLAPKLMAVRGWSGRETLGAAVRELIDHGLLIQTRQGSRLDCSLFACTLYPMDCDLRKLDVGPGSYRVTDWMHGGALANPPTETNKAVWRHARKGASTGSRKAGKTQTVAPPRDEVPAKRPAPGQTDSENEADFLSSSRPGTKTPVFEGGIVPPRVTYIDKPSLCASLPPFSEVSA